MFRYVAFTVLMSLSPHLHAQPADEVRVVIAFFEQVQRLSFEYDRNTVAMSDGMRPAQ